MLADKAQLGEQSCRGNSPANCNAACPTARPRPSKRIHPQARTHRLPSCSRANASRSSTAAFLAASQVRHSLSWRSRSARNSVSACRRGVQIGRNDQRVCVCATRCTDQLVWCAIGYTDQRASAEARMQGVGCWREASSSVLAVQHHRRL